MNHGVDSLPVARSARPPASDRARVRSDIASPNSARGIFSFCLNFFCFAALVVEFPPIGSRYRSERRLWA